LTALYPRGKYRIAAAAPPHKGGAVEVPTRLCLAPAVFSLQARLDQIAREREVLSVLQSLARLGLREGDMVSNTASGATGRISVRRHDGPAVAVVQIATGAVEIFDAQLLRSTGAAA